MRQTADVRMGSDTNDKNAKTRNKIRCVFVCVFWYRMKYVHDRQTKMTFTRATCAAAHATASSPSGITLKRIPAIFPAFFVFVNAAMNI